MKNISIIFFIVFFSYLKIWGQGKEYTFSGFIHSKDSVEGLQKVKVTILEVKNIIYTDQNGFFYVSLQSGNYTIEIKKAGFVPQKKTFEINGNFHLEILLFEAVKEFEAVEIKALKSVDKIEKIGQIELKMKDIKDLPAFMGEVDILKSIQLLPGVSSVNDGGQGFYVRGGSPDQNLVLLDNVPLYNASHLFGFFSVFNTDAVSSANLIKGSIPSKYGGRMSSVLEITSNEGNKEKLKVNGGIGLISSRLEIETPLFKRKGSLMVAARRTYLDVITKPFIPLSSPFYGSSYFFYDINLKANVQLSGKDNISFNAYNGIDQFQYINKTDAFNVKIPWGNTLFSMLWKHQFNANHSFQTTNYYTFYRFSFGSDQTEFSIKLESGIKDIGQKIDFSYQLNSKHKIHYGLDYIHHTFNPSSLSARQGETILNTGNKVLLNSHETALYLSDNFTIKKQFSLNAGLRYSSFLFVGPFKRFEYDPTSGNLSSIKEYKSNEPIKFYGGFEPRIQGIFTLRNGGVLKGGYTFHYQYVHLTSISPLSLPTDVWFPATDIAKPEKAYQVNLGFFKSIVKLNIETSVEIYYKGMKNLVDYKPGAIPSNSLSDNIDNLLVFGTGKSYGIEFFAKKNSGKFTGWIGFTLAKTERFFSDIQATPFPAKYDRTHDLSIVGTYKHSDRWTFGTSFIFATGNTLTLPSNWYLHDQTIVFSYQSRNSTRMPNYQRLDLSATRYSKTHKLKWSIENNEFIQVPKRFLSNWNFSIYNVYNQANPFFIYLQGSGFILKGNFKMKLKQVTLFPIIPSVTWNFSF